MVPVNGPHNGIQNTQGYSIKNSHWNSSEPPNFWFPVLVSHTQLAILVSNCCCWWNENVWYFLAIAVRDYSLPPWYPLQMPLWGSRQTKPIASILLLMTWPTPTSSLSHPSQESMPLGDQVTDFRKQWQSSSVFLIMMGTWASTPRFSEPWVWQRTHDIQSTNKHWDSPVCWHCSRRWVTGNKMGKFLALKEHML